MKSLYKMLVSDGYSLKFIIDDVLIREIDFASKKVVIIINNESAMHKNEIIESEIKKIMRLEYLEKTKRIL